VAIPGRPRPREETYRGCPPWGKGGDSVSNLLHNRIDAPRPVRAFTFTQLVHLPVPGAAAMTPMCHWSRATRAAVYRYEGLGASLTGYIAKVSDGPKEQCNCNGRAGYDWHIRLGRSPHASTGSTIITEATPRVRDREHGFSKHVLDLYRTKGWKVRIEGWLFLDNDHPTDLDRDRATLWEIHPVTRIDVWHRGHWKKIAG
jgi:hypothetical protein